MSIILTVRQSNALAALNKSLQEASDCGMFDVVDATPSIINAFCDEMAYCQEQDDKTKEIK
ncbi:hypothetical protein ACQ27_gp447 [Klebsiella phage K64-1]|uniref:hypothetical protein n=1 Tax=Klebsiella phage K64-1 TaxID=1439894 RepID=UPI00248C0589|nr:hypothetical protein ACQ27_gp447 [Klebsiella phage K64-1]